MNLSALALYQISFFEDMSVHGKSVRMSNYGPIPLAWDDLWTVTGTKAEEEGIWSSQRNTWVLAEWPNRNDEKEEMAVREANM
jgi:hypothetical protein